MSKCPSFSLVRYNSWHWLKHNKDLAPHVNWLHSFLWLPYWLMPQLNQPHYASRNEPGINLPFSSPGTVALRRCEGRGEGGSTVRMRWKGSGGGRVLCLWLILRERNYTCWLKESQSSTCVDTSMSFCRPNVWVCFTTFTQCRRHLELVTGTISTKELSALFMGTKVMVHGLPCEDTDPATFWVTSYGNNLDYYI